MEVIIVKAFLGVVFGGFVLAFLQYGTFSARLTVKPRFLVMGWVGVRLLPFGLVYLLLGYFPQSDINGFFLLADAARKGEVVYRDFLCTYSPFYPYLLGFSLGFWDNTRSMVLLMVLMEGLALVTSWYFYRSKFSEAELSKRIWIYLLLPAPLVFCVLGTQEDVWIWLFVALAAYGWERKQNYIVFGSILLLGMLTTKAIFVLVVPAILVLLPDPYRLGAVMAIGGTIVLSVLCYLVGLEFLQPVQEANTLRAPNIPSVLNPWFFDSIGVGEKIWNWAGLVVSVGGGCLAALQLRHLSFVSALSRVFVVVYATMMIVQQSAYSNYLFIFAIPLVLEVIDWNNKRQVIWFLVYNILCVVHPSYWWREGRPMYNSPGDIFAGPATILDYAMQVSVILLTIFFIRLSFRSKAPVPYAGRSLFGKQ